MNLLGLLVSFIIHYSFSTDGQTDSSTEMCICRAAISTYNFPTPSKYTSMQHQKCPRVEEKKFPVILPLSYRCLAGSQGYKCTTAIKVFTFLFVWCILSTPRDAHCTLLPPVLWNLNNQLGYTGSVCLRLANSS